MPTLPNVLAQIPGYGGFAARRQQLEEQESSDLQRASVLQQLHQRQQTAQQAQTDRATALQDAANLKTVMDQSGGDPARAIQALLKAGTPKSIELASKLKGLLPNPELAENRASREAMAAEAIASREAMAAEALAQRSADAAAQREQRMEELKLRLAETRAGSQERNALARELALMRADQQRMAAEQQRANSPQAIKEREKQAGKSSLGSLLDELEGDYVSYEKLGADIDPSRSSVGNVLNRIGSSAVGQFVGGAVGTKEQEIRDSINQKRASLMAALKQATGMGATQLNSNVELQFYLRMATDPTMARSANRKAIEWLRSTYGIQGGGAGMPPATEQAPAAPQGWSIRPIP